MYLVFVAFLYSFSIALPGDGREGFPVTAALELGDGAFIHELPARFDDEGRLTLVHETPAN